MSAQSKTYNPSSPEEFATVMMERMEMEGAL
jgi:hypothetical protein